MAVGVQKTKEHKKFSFVTLIILLIPIVLGYAALVYVPVWWTNSDVNAVLRKWANSAYNEKDVGALRKGIVGDLEKLGIEYEQNALEITFEEPDKDYIWITFNYDREIDLPLLGRSTITHWNHEVETDLSRFVW